MLARSQAVTTQQPATSAASSKQPDAADFDILAANPDGGVVRLRRLGGSTVGEVELMSGSVTKPLGAVKLLVNGINGQESLKATCKQHKKCSCWISSSRNADLLFQWLADGRDLSADDHQNSAKQLKLSIGMKVKK